MQMQILVSLLGEITMKPRTINGLALRLATAGAAILCLAPSQAVAATETVLYAFKTAPDGEYPFDRLISVKGTLYGTTNSGGSNTSFGTIFSMTAAGTEKTIYNFCSKSGCTDGASPYAGLLHINGSFYGTTEAGGSSGNGTVFSIASGKEKVLHSFTGNDGQNPQGDLIAINGTLYGTTNGGGANGIGTVFSVDPSSGAETVLHSFAGAVNDGSRPAAGLLNFHGTLYGTTSTGGSNSGGTVFSITTSGKEKIIYSFGGKSGDAGSPYGGLIAIKDTLYGTTQYGGGSNNGTVFSVTVGGTEKVLHAFDFSDGQYPYGSLLNLNGTMYGITQFGGANGYGTVFSITKSGTEEVVYSFKGGNDGALPYAGLINVNGTLYGTTEAGGPNTHGTVYSIVP